MLIKGRYYYIKTTTEFEIVRAHKINLKTYTWMDELDLCIYKVPNSDDYLILEATTGTVIAKELSKTRCISSVLRDLSVFAKQQENPLAKLTQWIETQPISPRYKVVEEPC